MVRDWLTPDEADRVMQNVAPSSRRWCIVGCGLRPFDDPALLPSTMGCACSGCLYRALTWAEFEAWQEREKSREPTPYIEPSDGPPTTPPLADRLASHKAAKRNAHNTSERQ